MRFNLNLATHPYEDVRRFYMKWLPLLAALALITIALTVKAYLTYVDGRKIEDQISQRRTQIDQLQKEQMAAQQTLNLPENSGASHQAQFLNDLFHRKAFSWTQVMADLEKIMPAQVQVVSIRPELDARDLANAHTGHTNGRLVVESRDGVEDRRHFARPGSVTDLHVFDLQDEVPEDRQDDQHENADFCRG